ncbi:MAG: alpha-galactosidase [Pseudonocardiales bacterium]|nr:alpha-galactosidase [Pseudonocardiales bacterium]
MVALGAAVLAATATAAIGTASSAAAIGTASAAAAPAPSYNGLALTPPMGFNDWNAFGCNVSQDLVEQTALAMHQNGMQAAGYDYVNIDDCWMNGRNVVGTAAKIAAGRDANGHLVADPTYFPDGIAALAKYVHSLGMKLGIYEDIGTATCQGLAGSYGHEATDAQDFANWGVDYLKYDDCFLPPQIPPTPAGYQAAYQVMSDALAATGRPIVYSVCEHTEAGQSWLWGATQSNLWRSTSDIRPNFASMLTNFTKNSVLADYAGPGHWNDPDMLEIGTGAITKLAAPAVAGDTNVKVASVSAAIPGSPITVGTATGGNLQSATVSSVGTAATTTTLFAPAATGDSTVKVASVSGFTIGGPITVDTGAGAQSATVTSVGTAGAKSTLFTGAAAGDTNVKVASIAGLTVGQPILIDTGASQEAPVVTSIGTAGSATTLSAATTPGAANIKVASVAGLAVGDSLAIDTGANREVVTISTVGTAGGTGTGVTFTPALALTHARGAAVLDVNKPGTGVSFTPALASAHAAGTVTEGDGTGIAFTPTLTAAHPIGTSVVGPTGTGITLTAPLTQPHASGDGVGISGSTVPESQSELSLWAAEAAPLIAGTDVVNMAAQNLAVYTNKDVIAVNQDPLGVQAQVLSNANSQWTLVKPLADGAKAVVLFNAGATPWTGASVSLAALGLDPKQAYDSRDLWTHSSSTVRDAIGVASIPAHGSVMVRVSSAETLVGDQLALVGSADGGSFAAQLQAVLSSLSKGKSNAACGQLGAYVSHVKAQSGKALTSSLAAQLVANAAQIDRVIDC